MTEVIRHVIDRFSLPSDFPTHLHTAIFWENLGRTVATFGLLEDVLCKAIFAFTATRPYDDAEISDAYEQWLPKLERALSDQLSRLIDTYGKSVREHPNATFSNILGKQQGLTCRRDGIAGILVVCSSRRALFGWFAKRPLRSITSR